jgi:hypothetical protein
MSHDAPRKYFSRQQHTNRALPFVWLNRASCSVLLLKAQRPPSCLLAHDRFDMASFE